MIKLGNVVRDKITGFTGVVVCRSEWLNGCVRVAVQPKELKDGVPIKECAFDEDQLEVISEDFKQSKKTGGDREMPSRPEEPSR